MQAVCDRNYLAVSEGDQVAELSDAVLNKIQSTKASKLPLSSLPPSGMHQSVKALLFGDCMRIYMAAISQCLGTSNSV